MEIQTKNGVSRIAGETNALLNPFTILEGIGVTGGRTVADIGCGGVGFFVFPAAKLVGDNGTLYAVDILKENLNAIRSRAKQEGANNIRLIWSNVEMIGGTDIQENSVDIALVVNTLFQTNKMKDVLKEMYRIVKPGGRLAVIDWKSLEMPFGPPLFDKTNKEKIRHYALLAGFADGGDFEAGKYHFGLNLLKRK